MWKAITLAAPRARTRSRSRSTKISGGKVTGPITENWTIAQGSLRGTIYYETYDSQIAGGLGSVGIMKIAAGRDDSRAVDQERAAATSATPRAPTARRSSPSTRFPGRQRQLRPQEQRRASSRRSPSRSSPTAASTPTAASSSRRRTTARGSAAASRVYDTKTRREHPDAELGQRDQERRHARVLARRQAHRLQPRGHRRRAHARDDGLRRESPRRSSASSTSRRDPASYLGVARVHAGQQVGRLPRRLQRRVRDRQQARRAISTPSISRRKTTARLDALDGYAGGRRPTCPRSDPQPQLRAHHAARGGGRILLGRLHEPPLVRQHPAVQGQQRPERQALGRGDRHRRPAPARTRATPRSTSTGRSRRADNLRGFWVLDPCKQDGKTCTSGDQCCGGFCRSDRRRPAHVRSTPAAARTSSRSAHDRADCCNSTDQCINGKCAVIVN